MFEDFITEATSKYITNQDLILILVLVLIFVITFSLLIYTPLFKENKKIAAIISLCIALLAVFFMNQGQIFYSFLIGFGSFGIVLFFIIPLLIVLAIAHSSPLSTVGRKILIGFFTLIQTVWWFNQRSSLSSNENTVRLTMIGICILLIVLDDLVHKILKKQN